MIRRLLLALAGAAMLPAAAPAAPGESISLADSFRLGSGAGILCSAQVASADKAIVDPFDRAYAITCRDASVPVGRLYALRVRGEDPLARLAGARADVAECSPEAGSETLDGLGAVAVIACTVKGEQVGYRVYSVRRGSTLYVAEGFAGYDSALRLGLRTVVADRPVPGEIAIATTDAGDPAAFARAQAGSLDPQRALAEAYRRNNSGSYADAAEFFGALLAGNTERSERVEALINQGLQQSNLGAYAEAEQLFAQAQRDADGDPVLARMLRNYRAIHQLNQGRPAAALRVLDAPLAAAQARMAGSVADLVIDSATAARLNGEAGSALAAGGTGLTPDDKAQILDGQALQLRGGALRLLNRPTEAMAALDRAVGTLGQVRGGRVASAVWLQAQMLGELGSIAEETGDAATAERQYQASVALIAGSYPASPALLNAQARLAAFYQRRGKTEQARALYRQIVDANADESAVSPALRRLLAPYFALLAGDGGQGQAAADMFKAGQLLVRPGVAQTQAVLARELSGGSDDAARLFRQSVNLTRDIERSRVEIARLAALTQPTSSELVRLADLRTQLAAVERDQTATQAKLAAFPRYRVVSGGAMSLADLQAVLRPGEAYYKMMVVGGDVYAVYATAAAARGFKVAATAGDLDAQVTAIRGTISTVENGERVTYPFDAELAYKLFGELFAPVAGELGSVTHLIFEPDGAMLRLPANVLVTDHAGVEAYIAKARRPNDDGFDFTDIAWLGRDRDVSTSVSARAFRDVRQAPRSTAKHDYIGFGNNAVPSGEIQTASATRGLLGTSISCDWPIAEWARPISPDELVTASRILGGGDDTTIVTGAQFSDTAIKERPDLSGYRIMHFATHGLVTAPRPDCPARPALLTSFGGSASDGLLTFAEIYDLKLDADLVILSACDTAGAATSAATLEAGVRTGGDQALDGLVRAFVGAGGRSVIASHWPVPDDYDATKRLISGLFTAPPGTPVATALRTAERQLMASPDTSHPYYWAGFAIVGDGAAPVIPAKGDDKAPATAVAPSDAGKHL